MVETPRIAKDLASSSTEREIAPNVHLRQTEADGQFVEIVLPPYELNALLQECEQYFPAYAIQVLDRLARTQPERLAGPQSLSAELTEGLKNTQMLGMVLAHHRVCGQRALEIMPELQQAFGLAMKGRLKLTADLIPELE